MLASEARRTRAHGFTEPGHAGAAVITLGAGARVAREAEVVAHLAGGERAALEVDLGLAVDDQPLDGAVQTNQDPSLRGHAVQTPGNTLLRFKRKLQIR